MFDDAHMLESSQRVWLREELERHDRTAFASWMAMRLRALEPLDLITEESRPGRERFAPVQFGRWLHGNESWLIDIGDRRARRAQRDVSSLAACLADSIETEFDQQYLVPVAAAERQRAYELTRPYGDLFRDWMARTDSEVQSSPLDQANHWSQLQILMERRVRKVQGEFIFDSMPSHTDLEKLGAGTAEPAALFVANRNKLPYFYGVRRVAQLASFNVEQFLALSGALFDRLLNSGHLGRRLTRQLSPSDQHRLIQSKSRAYVEQLRTSLPYGQDVFNLITAIAELCKEESTGPTFRLRRAVTGVSIQVSESGRAYPRS